MKAQSADGKDVVRRGKGKEREGGEERRRKEKVSDAFDGAEVRKVEVWLGG